MRKLLTGVLLVSLLLALSFGSLTYYLLYSPVTPTETIDYQLQPGASLIKVARDLESSGVVRTSLSLRFFARLEDVGEKIHTGHYRFSEQATPQQILHRLATGDVEKVSLTIPEGFTLQQIVERIQKLGYGDKTKLLQLAYDKSFIASFSLQADSLEGYLYPETYLFTPGVSEKQLLTMMVKQFLSNLPQNILAAAKKNKLDFHELVTLASIIEKETGKMEEMPLISSVFHNRLKKGMQLQTDPTVIYGIKNFDGNLTRKHLKSKTPYNTYIIRGLPPGPIASPGLAALKAAAIPAESQYLYFVAKGDGSHHFSKTLKEHNRAVRKYQLNR
ncbi:UPF0755 protein [Malonomonas rubra DSM 5091]|uniref:Endolytic murein transglycosylase n=1 Tax=Malonomonas rubra DSM 5091 TaxID=1122189 RepID=A0A1M6HN34_MALRU|nr:endolytic transglycosylase MltG [Malonomonas rubra]SHJ23536.1 UPF0755 protein [Malonomonas rubra DSM 5091]